MRPAVALLMMREPVGVGNGIRLCQAVRGNVTCFDPLRGFHAQVDRFAVHGGVNQQVTTWIFFGPSSRAIA